MAGPGANGLWFKGHTSGPGGRSIRWSVRQYAEVDSTNRVVAELAREGAPDGIVVVADHQTAGRGRWGRRWEAPPGSSLLVSVLLRPAVDPSLLPLATLAAGVAASEACQEVTGHQPTLKWPNDLVMGSLKLGGILVELVGPGAGLVVGLGLNVNWQEEPPTGATSLNRLVGADVDREALLGAFLARLDARAGDIGEPVGREQLLGRYRQLCTTLGQEVTVRLAGRDLTGLAIGVSSRGGLLVEAAGGVAHEVLAGEVRQVAQA